MKTVAIDAGHGLYTPGKRTPDDEREWSFNSTVVKSVISQLKKYDGVKVIRMDDATGKTDVPLITRTNKANNAKADVYVSIHHNANTGKWGTWTGVETFVMSPASSNPKSMSLAKAIHPSVVKGMGLHDRGIKSENFHVLRETDMPAILIECGYMDSTIDIKKLRSIKTLKSTGVLIANAIASHLGLKLKAVKPKTPCTATEAPKKTSTSKTPSTTTKTPKTEIAVITVDHLNVRRGAGVQHGVITTVKKNEAFTVKRKLSNGWIQFISGGYVNGKYVKLKTK